MKNIWTWLVNPSPDGPASTLLLRLMAGGVFLWEGILKFVYLNQGVGRFTKLGMPFPHFTADFVGYLEIVGGLLLLSGLMTRLIAIPFIIEMIVAILST
ncbi:MAG: DoxX family protein, partial [Acidobacteria bacterium]